MEKLYQIKFFHGSSWLATGDSGDEGQNLKEIELRAKKKLAHAKSLRSQGVGRGKPLMAIGEGFRNADGSWTDIKIVQFLK